MEGTYKIADRMLEPGMRDEEQKRRKISNPVVGGEDLKGDRRAGGGGGVGGRGSCARGATSWHRLASPNRTEVFFGPRTGSFRRPGPNQSGAEAACRVVPEGSSPSS